MFKRYRECVVYVVVVCYLVCYGYVVLYVMGSFPSLLSLFSPLKNKRNRGKLLLYNIIPLNRLC